MAKARGSACFDFEAYRTHNPDLNGLTQQSTLWKHFVHFGQFEDRVYNFSCDADLSGIASGHGTASTHSHTAGHPHPASVLPIS
jgi:hypothetical protein